MVSIEGACLCGGVAFSYSPPSLWCAHCHCRMCRRAHGAPLVTWVGVAESQFHLEAGASLSWYRSSPEARRGFCRHCGSTLLFQSSRWPGEIHIARANLSEQIDREPAAHVYCASRALWLDLGDSLPRLDDSGGS